MYADSTIQTGRLRVGDTCCNTIHFGPRHENAPDRLIIWRPFRLLFFQLFWVAESWRNFLSAHSRTVDNFRRYSFACQWGFDQQMRKKSLPSSLVIIYYNYCTVTSASLPPSFIIICYVYYTVVSVIVRQLPSCETWSFRNLCNENNTNYYYYYCVTCHGPFLPGMFLEPAVNPIAQVSSFTLVLSIVCSRYSCLL